MILVIFLLITVTLTTCETKITLNITISSYNQIDVKANGDDLKLPTDLEFAVFKINEDTVKKGFKFELGKSPDDVFYKDPTPYGDLFRKYKWKEVTRRIRVKRTKLVEIIKEKVVIKRLKHINNSTENLKVKISPTINLETTVSTFNYSNPFPLDKKLFYNLNIDLKYGNFSTTNPWRKNIWKNAYFSIGDDVKTDFNLHPGTSIISEVLAYKTIIIVKVTYSASLEGNFIGNYAHVYAKYHFWAPNVVNIMKAAGLVTEKVMDDLIEIRCYTNPVLVIYDGQTKNMLKIVKSKKNDRGLKMHFDKESVYLHDLSKA